MVLSENGRSTAVALCEDVLPQLRPRIVEAVASMAGGPGVADKLADEARDVTIYSIMNLVEHFLSRVEGIELSEDQIIRFCVEQAIHQMNTQSFEIIAETMIIEAAGSRPKREQMH